MRKSLFSFLFVFLLIFSNTSFVFAAEPIDEVRGLIEKYYVDPVPETTLQQSTIQEITDLLDPHSVYMTTNEFTQFYNSLNQELVGIGIVLEEHELGIKVLQTFPNAPADKAGILPGDVITHVNGESLAGKSTQYAVSVISGAENTRVTLTFLQNGTSYIKTVTRERIFLPNVESDLLAGNIGYIRLNSFSEDAADDIQDAIRALPNVEGYIFDLRNNGGGYVSTAQDVIGLFPNSSFAFQLKERANVVELYRSLNQYTKFDKPVHLLINGNSASASEMVAAAVKDQNSATLYGQTSYGKGSMQSIFMLSDQSVLKLTTGRFYSPNGAAIDGIGVAPDVETEIGEELAKAHFDFLKKNIPNYKELPSLIDVPTTKEFTLKFNMNMDENSITKEAINLIQLGGEEVEFEITILNGREVKISPKEELQEAGNYVLIIHPEWKSLAGKTLKQGNYLQIKVENKTAE